MERLTGAIQRVRLLVFRVYDFGLGFRVSGFGIGALGLRGYDYMGSGFRASGFMAHLSRV